MFRAGVDSARQDKLSLAPEAAKRLGTLRFLFGPQYPMKRIRDRPADAPRNCFGFLKPSGCRVRTPTNIVGRELQGQR